MVNKALSFEDTLPDKVRVDIRVHLSNSDAYSETIEYYPKLNGSYEETIERMRQIYPRLADAEITVMRAYDIFKSKIFG